MLIQLYCIHAIRFEPRLLLQQSSLHGALYQLATTHIQNQRYFLIYSLHLKMRSLSSHFFIEVASLPVSLNNLIVIMNYLTFLIFDIFEIVLFNRHNHSKRDNFKNVLFLILWILSVFFSFLHFSRKWLISLKVYVLVLWLWNKKLTTLNYNKLRNRIWSDLLNFFRSVLRHDPHLWFQNGPHHWILLYKCYILHKRISCVKFVNYQQCRNVYIRMIRHTGSNHHCWRNDIYLWMYRFLQ